MISILSSDLIQALLATVAATVVALALAATAFAGNVTLWACHGPGGQSLGVGPLTASSTGDGTATTYGSGCSGQAATLAAGGLAATFTRPDPASGSSAAWRVDVPAGTRLMSVALNRATSGLGGAPQPGDPMLYQLSTSADVLESASLADASDVALSGSTGFPGVSGDSPRFDVSCGPTPGGRCAPPIAGTVGVDVSSLALGVSDDNPPDVAIGGVASPVAGPLMLEIRATDDGVGLESATATLAGAPPVTVALGGVSCVPLSSSPTQIDLALGADCPTTVTDVPLALPTAGVDDGAHQLTVTVTDAAGNTTTAVNQSITVRNHPAIAPSSATVSLGSGGGSPGSSNPGGPTQGGGPFGVKPPVCNSPQLTAILASRPLRISKKGLAVLWGGTRYLFTGRLTCVVNHRRVGAPTHTVVHIRSLVGRRIVPRTGAAVYERGKFRVLLHPRSTRIIEFFFGTGKSRHVVPIHVDVTPHRGRP